jgi:hypothetical protein
MLHPPQGGKLKLHQFHIHCKQCVVVIYYNETINLFCTSLYGIQTLEIKCNVAYLGNLGISEKDDSLHYQPHIQSIQHSRIKPLAILLENLVLSCTTNLNIAKAPLLSLRPQTTTLVPIWKHLFFPRSMQME